ncbi:MAG TPA: hypothetical protein VHI72_16805, partial [Hyphomicrobiaceae bacterium]|nr:hypothetical protein [Hyphomicrobiaceae bacterium]
MRWARRKYTRMVDQTTGERDWFDRSANPKLFAHWPLCDGDGRTSGAMSLEGHARFWERLG